MFVDEIHSLVQKDTNSLSMSLTSSELKRYGRHLAMKEFSAIDQEKLKSARMLVIGAGGLGCPALLYLTAAGVGTIGIVEFDNVDLSNLQRQVLYTQNDIGKSKLTSAIAHLQKINPNVNFEPHPYAITSKNARSTIGKYDIVIDGTDNFPTRYLINDACVLEGKPNVYGSVLRFEGQVSVFNYHHEDGLRGPNYRDLFPTPPPPRLVPNCAEAGVLGVLPGIIGSMQASEAIKIATGIGIPLVGRIWIFDALSFESRTMKFKKNSDNQITELIDYEEFCGIVQSRNTLITSPELLEKITNSKVRVVDVREKNEYELDNIGAEHLPLSTIKIWIEDIDESIPIVMHCQTGKRSSQAMQMILNEYDDLEIYNLKGGINAWRRDLGSVNLPN